MTNREESSAAEHETFPGPGPLKTDEAKRGIRPVEQMVDAAIERIARETEARAGRGRSARAASTVFAEGAAAGAAEANQGLTLARSDAAALMALQEDDSQRSSSGSQLALATDQRGKGRLRWKGLDVSDEFRSYAERVARGEDLPPFTGKILAEPDPAFPWDPTAQKRAARRALKQQVGLWTGVAAFLGLSVAVLVVQVRKQADAWQAPDSPLATVTMTNQPSTPSASLPAQAAENAPAAFDETGSSAVALQASSPTAEASSAAVIAEASTAAVNAEQPAPSGVPAPAAPLARSAGPGAAPRVAGAAKLAPATPAAAGVFVATRAAAQPAAGSVVTSSTTASSATASSATVAEPAVKAVGTAGVPAASSVTAAAEVAGAGDPASALRADPKKEPTREASGMGSLLVESPSF